MYYNIKVWMQYGAGSLAGRLPRMQYQRNG